MNGAAQLGGLIFNLVEPFTGHETEFRRWYGTDHYYAGAMAGPGVVAGRCWQGTSAWTPDGVADVSRTFLGTFFLLAGALPAYQEWSADTHPWLAAAGRMFTQRRQVHRGRYSYARTLAGGEAAGPLSALDRDFPALLAVLALPAAPGEQRLLATGPQALAGEGLDIAFNPAHGGYSELAPSEHHLVLGFRHVPAEAISPGQLDAAVRRIMARSGQAAAWAGLFRPVPMHRLLVPDSA
jgi:hypothetical protein